VRLAFLEEFYMQTRATECLVTWHEQAVACIQAEECAGLPQLDARGREDAEDGRHRE
jgi:hypothetical protein